MRSSHNTFLVSLVSEARIFLRFLISLGLVAILNACDQRMATDDAPARHHLNMPFASSGSGGAPGSWCAKNYLSNITQLIMTNPNSPRIAESQAALGQINAGGTPCPPYPDDEGEDQPRPARGSMATLSSPSTLAPASSSRSARGSTALVIIPPIIPIPTIRQIVTGAVHTCALSSLGTVQCWGGNFTGQLGRTIAGDYTPTPLPIDMPLLPLNEQFITLAAGNYHTCGITTRYNIYCWGDNSRGQIGAGQPLEPPYCDLGVNCSFTRPTSICRHSASTPTCPASSEQFISIAAGGATTCALSRTGTLYCWGDNSGGQLGIPTANLEASFIPIRMGSTSDSPPSGVFRNLASQHIAKFGPVALGGRYTCSGDFCLPIEEDSNIVPAPGHACMAMTVGPTGAEIPRVFCWGDNSRGQLGWGTSGSTEVIGNLVNLNSVTPPLNLAPNPYPVIALGGVQSLSEFYCVSPQCTLGERFFGWGDNHVRQLLSCSATPHNPISQPCELQSTDIISAVIAGDSHACVTTPDPNRRLFCWGYNHEGQLGLGAAMIGVSPSQPTLLQFPSGEVSSKSRLLIAGTLAHTCAVSESGKPYCWGRNAEGQLGLSNTSGIYPAAATPIPINLWLTRATE